jgi:immunity protein 35 of polymorphic toxin system
VIDENSARSLAEEFLAREIVAPSGQELVLTDLTAYPHCWVVTFNTRRFAETRDLRYSLAGNGPLIVNRRTGAVRQGVSGRPIEEQLDEA